MAAQAVQRRVAVLVHWRPTGLLADRWMLIVQPAWLQQPDTRSLCKCHELFVRKLSGSFVGILNDARVLWRMALLMMAHGMLLMAHGRLLMAHGMLGQAYVIAVHRFACSQALH
jgi:hypothetical protein